MRLILADTSAWQRSSRAFDRWTELLETSNLAMCAPVALELLFSARNRTEHERLSGDLRSLPNLAIDRTVERHALQTQASLTQKSQHRGPRPIDLLIAAIAEVNGATLLHYDRHFDVISRVTGQPTEWLARRGTLD